MTEGRVWKDEELDIKVFGSMEELKEERENEGTSKRVE